MNPALPLTIKNLSSRYKEKTITPRQVIETIIDRSKQYADYNIWIIEPDMAFCDPFLQALESKTPEEINSLPLYGIPFAIKDNIDLAQYPTTAGCPAYSYTPKAHATVVQNLLNAGAIPIGKTNLDQFATGLVGIRSPFGECHNALDPELISGGSSSGSAVSVALGLCAFALGTDTAGSGRVPAALNNLIGYKPPLGSWSTSGVVPACASLDCVSVFANTTEDALLIDRVTQGFDDSCIWSRIIEERPSKFPSTIYLPTEKPTFYGPFKKEYQANWNASIDIITMVAHTNNTPVEAFDTQELSAIASILYDGPWVAERWCDLGTFVESHPDDIHPITKTILESGKCPDLSAVALFKAYHRIIQARHDMTLALKDSVLIMPTVGGTFTRDEVRKNPIETNSLMGLYTNHCNLCDLSALAIPGATIGTLPFGLTIFGTASEKNTLFNMANALLSIYD